MPNKKPPEEPSVPNQQIEPREITEELRESYLDYAMSVIVSRALPDVRDGMKPVQRRILWAMWDSGLTHGVKFRKSANVVGEVLGRYHPHGDTAVYDAMARMAQDFSLRYPLIDGQGNWGCFTGDTKVKLADGRSVSFKTLVKEYAAGGKNYTYTFNHETQKIEIAEILHPRLTRKNAEVVRVILDSGESVECTPDHKFMMRDGSYKSAQKLQPGDSLMPGYMRLSTREDDVHAVGYTMIHQPVSALWDWSHRLADEWNIRKGVYQNRDGRVRHHKDFNKRNNNPGNIMRMGWKEHWNLHADSISFRHKNDPEYMQRLNEGRARYICAHRALFSKRVRVLNQKLWQSEDFRNKHRARMQEMWSRPAYKARMRDISSSVMKEKWRDSSYREFMGSLKSKEMRERWNDPEYRTKQSARMRGMSTALWMREDHRKHISWLSKTRMSDPARRAAQSKIAKALWNNPAFRARYEENHFSVMAKKLWNNPATRAFHREKAIHQWQDPEFRKTITHAVGKSNLARLEKNPHLMDELAVRAATALAQKWKDPHYKEQVIKSRILGYAYSLLKKYQRITPSLYEQKRKNNGVPRLERALKYFKNFREIVEHAPLYNHTVATVSTVKKRREDVYDITVRNTHNFLLDIGIFVHNSVDGDAPAAMRYTETRLSKISEELLTDIEKETVDWLPNYDATREEPGFLPAKLPNLLLNGAVGIAVGMTTSIPPHNLVEIADATMHLANHPGSDVKELMQFVKGPDFPTGGVIYDRRALEEAYATGKGSVTTRGKTEIEERKNGSFQIVISEIPYQVNKSTLITKIAELVQEKKIEGIKDVRDESDREGLRIVIELKNDVRAQRILNQLFEYTELQKNFHYNMLALTNGLKPEILSLKDILGAYLDHRKIVIRRRTEFDLRKAEERAHILEGLVKALGVIDKIIATIKKSKDKDDARQNLVKNFKLTPVQADAILEMKLQSLAALERQKLEDELKEKKKLIEELKLILKEPKRVLGIIKHDLEELKKNFPDPRRTNVIASGLKEFKEEDLIPKEEALITLTEDGYIKRMPPGTFRVQKRGGKGLIGFDLKEEDQIYELLSADTHDNILFFTTKGRVFQTKVYEVPVASRTAKGKSVYNFLDIPTNEKVSAVVTYPQDYIEDQGERTKHFLVMTTQRGIIKRTPLKDFGNVRRTGIIAIKLQSGDLLEWVRLSGGDDQIVLVTAMGQAIRFKEKDVRSMGRSAAGVRALNLKKQDTVSGLDIIRKEDLEKGSKISLRVLAVMANGFAKQTSIKEYKLQRRGGSGIKTAKITPKTGPVIGAHIVDDEVEGVLAFSSKGQALRANLKDIRVLSRATQGVKIMNLEKGDTLVGIVCL